MASPTCFAWSAPVRRIAYDVTLEADDALRRIRDLYAEYDQPEGSSTP
jgi:hypothetical protein